MVNNWDDVLELWKQMSKVHMEALKERAEQQRRISKNLTEILLPINTKAETIKDAFLQIASIFFLPSLLSKYSELTKYGWYISPSYFKFIDGADDAIFLESKTGDFEIDYSELEMRINKNFPSYLKIIHRKANKISIIRRPIFDELFELYKKKKYYSLIPLALIQVDGLSKEYFNMGFFATEHPNNKNQNKSRQKIKSVLEENDTEGDEFEDMASLILLFSQVSFDDRNELVLIRKGISDMSMLNRHSILHGESCDYGSKENAIKALLLLDFVLDLMKSFRKKLE
jgi:hypothetical protein